MLGPLEIRRRNAVKAAFVPAGAQVGAMAQLFGHPLGVLDDLAVHVDDVHGAIGPDFEIHGAGPLIARGEELVGMLFEAFGEGDPVGFDAFVVDEIARGLAGEDVAVVVGREGVAAVVEDAAGGGELAGVQVRSRPSAADGEDRRVVRAEDHVFHDGIDRDERVFLHVVVFEHDVDRGVAVRTDEAIVVVVEREAELGFAGDGFEFAREGIEAEVAAAERDGLFLRTLGVDDGAAAEAAGDVDAVVERERWDDSRGAAR